MIRTLAVVSALLFTLTDARAQLTVRVGPRPVVVGQPAGVIQPPALPLPGSPLQHMTVAQPRFLPRPAFVNNPFVNYFGYGPFWPAYVDPVPTPVVNNIYLPAPTPAAPIAPPPPPPELRARLTLNLPSGARVWLAGKEVDAAAIPVVLRSPVLEEGQRYAFDIKVTWLEGRNPEERTRIVEVDAGDSKSLTYTAVR